MIELWICLILVDCLLQKFDKNTVFRQCIICESLIVSKHVSWNVKNYSCTLTIYCMCKQFISKNRNYVVIITIKLKDKKY